MADRSRESATDPTLDSARALAQEHAALEEQLADPAVLADQLAAQGLDATVISDPSV